MKRITHFTMALSVSLISLLSGCSAGHAEPAQGNSTLKDVSASTIATGTQHTKPSGQAPKLKISSTTKTSSQEVFTFNQPIKDVKVSDKSSILLRTTDQSVTIQRSKTVNETVGILVTLESGTQQRVTLHVPKSRGAKNSHSNRSAPSSKTIKGTPAPLIYFGPASGRRIYITVDDGWYPSQRVLRLMQSKHVPITAFLIQKAAAEHLKYWQAFVKAGGVIQDHTVNHPWLTKVPYKNALAEWQGPTHTYPKWFGQSPTLGRPPYGAVDKTVRIAAHNAGLKDIVMWSAEFNPKDPSKGLQTWNHKPLSPGEIIILHWTPGLYSEIEQVLTICKTRHLVPAPLKLSVKAK